MGSRFSSFANLHQETNSENRTIESKSRKNTLSPDTRATGTLDEEEVSHLTMTSNTLKQYETQA